MRKRTTNKGEEYYARRRAQAARYRAEHPERHREASRKWDKAHPRKSTKAKRAKERQRMRLKRQQNPGFEKEYAVRYRAENREALRLRTAEHRRKHPEKVAEANAKRRANKEVIRMKNAEWLAANPGKSAIYSKRYALKYPEKHKASMRRWRKTHPEAVKARLRRRRSLIRGASISDLTDAQWREIKEAYGYRCVYCNRKMQRLTQDHLTPLSQGGNHTASNVVPACQSCNSKKNNGAVLHPVQPLLLTVAPRHTKKEK